MTYESKSLLITRTSCFLFKRGRIVPAFAVDLLHCRFSCCFFLSYYFSNRTYLDRTSFSREQRTTSSSLTIPKSEQENQHHQSNHYLSEEAFFPLLRGARDTAGLEPEALSVLFLEGTDADT